VPIPFENALDQIRAFQAFNGGHIVPYIKWNAQSGFDVSIETYHGITSRDVADGKLDGYIHEYARAVRAYGGPLFMSPVCSEFNGRWWANCSPLYNPKLTVTDFIAAWRRTVDIFRLEGVTNVAWVWNPVPNFEYAPYYPGDDYVDWAGADIYDDLKPADMEGTYQLAVAHGKPFFIGEWGVRISDSKLTPPEQRAWLDAMFDYFESHPKIKAIDYYNYNQTFDQENTAHMASHVYLYGGQVNYHPNVNNADSRLLADSGAGFRTTFASRIARARYASAVSVAPAATPTPIVTLTAIPSPRPTSTVVPTATPAPTNPTPESVVKDDASLAEVTQWLYVLAETPALGPDDEVAWLAEPDEWYRVVAIEGGWVLAAREGDGPDALVWLQIDDRIALITVPPDQP
jgi:hypothetical protein